MKKNNYSQPLVSVLVFSSELMQNGMGNPSPTEDTLYDAPSRNLYL